MKILLSTVAMLLVASFGFFGGSVNSSAPGWFTLQQVEASPYRRSVRRTARRTSRRTARRQDYIRGGPYYGGAAVVGAAAVTAVAIGTMVATLPPACNTVIVNGVSYHNCSGTYYRPQGTQYIVVEAPR